jgi:epoxyqueuosine reductase
MRPLHAQGAQQVAHQGGLARAQVAVQFDEGVAQRAQDGELLRERARLVLGAPGQVQGAFYNPVMTVSTGFGSAQGVSHIRQWGRELGFSQIGVAGVDLSSAEPGLLAWLAQGFHGDMAYMQRHGLRRARPAELVPGTVSVISARMDYLSAGAAPGWQDRELARLRRPGEAVVSLYARGRDYHKVLRARLQKLADRIAEAVGPLGHRVFTDSAPVLEAELAVRSGLGWRGKHTLVLDRTAGSMFFLGEIYVDLALPPSAPVEAHCGSCDACLTACPTRAIVAPYRLDARRCISYLTIEHAGPIPLELRPLIGNRIYGCDDCQLVCPWNKFAQRSVLPDFDERAGLTGQQLAALLGWNDGDFLHHTEGSAIRRIGHERWQRNLAVAAGNALRQAPDPALVQALAAARVQATPLVQEHLDWALAQAG